MLGALSTIITLTTSIKWRIIVELGGARPKLHGKTVGIVKQEIAVIIQEAAKLDKIQQTLSRRYQRTSLLGPRPTTHPHRINTNGWQWGWGRVGQRHFLDFGGGGGRRF